MNTLNRVVCTGLALVLGLGGASIANEVRELMWDDLIPEGTEIQAPVGHSGDNWAEEDDWGSDSFEEAFSSPVAEVVEELDGIQAKIPGFIVPLELAGEGQIKEFLLVPYFGACIHYPPPPLNQIVYVVLDEAAEVESMWEPIWATGTLKTEIRHTGMGSAGYMLSAQSIELYEY